MSLSFVIYITRNRAVLRKNMDEAKTGRRSYGNELQPDFYQNSMVFRLNNMTKEGV